MSLPNKPSLVEYKGQRFLIIDAPSETNLPQYITHFETQNVKQLVRVCEATYSTDPLSAVGITVHDWFFADGAEPPTEVVDKWLNLVDTTFSSDNTNNATIAVHCVAGLGRAPVLVAVALIELGVEALDAVQQIREKRRGAINSRQLKFLEAYKPRKKKKSGICTIL